MTPRPKALAIFFKVIAQARLAIRNEQPLPNKVFVEKTTAVFIGQQLCLDYESQDRGHMLTKFLVY